MENISIEKLLRFELQYKTAVEQEHVIQKKLDAAVVQGERLQEAQIILQTVTQAIQQQVHEKISGVVSKCLEAVFEEPYTFRIVFEQKRGRTEARLVFLRAGQELDPMTAAGGGVVDVTAFALRLACLVLAKPTLRRLVILDEPFKFVSAAYRGRVRTMLETLADELKVQFIMVTHIPELQTGTVVDLS
jgi:hypothetical protein